MGNSKKKYLMKTVIIILVLDGKIVGDHKNSAPAIAGQRTGGI
jgi:hypothetical protein